MLPGMMAPPSTTFVSHLDVPRRAFDESGGRHSPRRDIQLQELGPRKVDVRLGCVEKLLRRRHHDGDVDVLRQSHYEEEKGRCLESEVGKVGRLCWRSRVSPVND